MKNPRNLHQGSITYQEPPVDAAITYDLPGNIEEIGHALTAKEVGALLSFKRTALCKMTKAGTIPSFKLSTSVHYDPYRIAEWLRARTR
jgi:predicted DNA-binding transcriptional regulator AlpA